MNNNRLYGILEACLNDLERGTVLEDILARYPDCADELRPLLQLADDARASAVITVPEEVIKRGRARVLQAAAELREQKKARPMLSPFWRREASSARTFRLAFTVAAILVFLLTGGTGLVRASSGSLPGDQLYPVKRTWEDVHLLFTFENEAREKLAIEYEQEREYEISELIEQGRMEKVTLQGILEDQPGGQLTVSGIPVMLGNAAVDDIGLSPGSYVEIEGETHDGKIDVLRLTLQATPVLLPTTAPALSTPVISSDGQDDERSETPEEKDHSPTTTSEPEKTVTPVKPVQQLTLQPAKPEQKTSPAPDDDHSNDKDSSVNPNMPDQNDD